MTIAADDTLKSFQRKNSKPEKRPNLQTASQATRKLASLDNLIIPNLTPVKVEKQSSIFVGKFAKPQAD
jgi:hypothetical protein